MSNYKLQTLNVFVNEDRQFGNPVGIVIDESANLPKEERQKICLDSGFSEVVFIESIKESKISIFSPTGEIPFAGHAILGAAYFISQINNRDINYIECMGSKIEVRHVDKNIWIKANLKTMPSWNFKEFSIVEEIDQLTLSNTKSLEHCYVWAWIDEQKGIIRARTFANDWLIPEDEANGSGSMLLAMKLRRNLKIIHGKGSVVYANFLDSEFAEVGGSVVEIKN